MANGNLITQAQKMYESELDTTDYAKLLTEPAVKAIGDMLKVQRVKTEALMAAMPAGVNISKVPEELRGKVTAYLTENKAAYTEAAKVVASGIKPTDQRYIDAIETMNRVRGGFETLDGSLVNIAEKRKAALESRDNISAGAHGHDSILHEKWSNGGIYNDFTLEDGNFYYINHEGNKVNANDYAGAMQQSTGITDGMLAYSNTARQLGKDGYDFEKEKGSFRGGINSMLKNAGKDGRVDFAYSGVYGIEETPFIDTYIKDRLNLQKHDDDQSGDISQAEFDKWHAYYKNEDFSAGTDMGNKLREYLLGTLTKSYDSGVAAKAAEVKRNQEINANKKTTWDTSYGNPSKVRANSFIDKINANSKIIFDLRKGNKWILQEDGKYRADGDSSQVRTRIELIEENEMDAYYPDIYSSILQEQFDPNDENYKEEDKKVDNKVKIEDVITESNLEVIEEEKSGKLIKYYSYSGNSITDADTALEAAENAGVKDAYIKYENNGKEITLREYSRLEDKSNVTFKVQLGVGTKSIKKKKKKKVEEQTPPSDSTIVTQTDTPVVETPIDTTTTTPTDTSIVETVPVDVEDQDYGPDNPDPMVGQINTSGDMILNESGKYIPIDSEEGKKIAKNYRGMQDEVTVSGTDAIKAFIENNTELIEGETPVIANTTEEVAEELVKENDVIKENVGNPDGNTNPIDYIIKNGYIDVNEAKADSDLVVKINELYNTLLGRGDTSLARKALTHDDKAWCGAFVYEVLTGTGAVKTKDIRVQSPEAYQKLRAAEYLNIGTPVDLDTEDPKMGDIIVVSRRVKNKKTGKLEKRYHVAFYSGTDDNGRPIMLGGNQDDQVSFKTVTDKYTIEGYRRMENMADVKEATAVDYKVINETYGVKGGEDKII